MDDAVGPFTVANGTNFTFTDPTYGFGTFMQVAFSAKQITRTNLIAGIFPATDFDGTDFDLLSGRPITSVSIDPSSSALFAPGSVLTYSANNIRIDLSGTCELCTGGESIVLNVAAAPEPTSLALLGGGILAGMVPVVRRRRRRAA